MCRNSRLGVWAPWSRAGRPHGAEPFSRRPVPLRARDRRENRSGRTGAAREAGPRRRGPQGVRMGGATFPRRLRLDDDLGVGMILAATGFFTRNGLAFGWRWLHIVFGVAWIGLLWYFNLVQVPSFAEYGT